MKPEQRRSLMVVAAAFTLGAFVNAAFGVVRANMWCQDISCTEATEFCNASPCSYCNGGNNNLHCQYKPTYGCGETSTFDSCGIVFVAGTCAANKCTGGYSLDPAQPCGVNLCDSNVPPDTN